MKINLQLDIEASKFTEKIRILRSIIVPLDETITNSGESSTANKRDGTNRALKGIIFLWNIILTVDYSSGKKSHYGTRRPTTALFSQTADEESMESRRASLIAEQPSKLVLFIGIWNGKFSMNLISVANRILFGGPKATLIIYLIFKEKSRCKKFSFIFLLEK